MMGTNPWLTLLPRECRDEVILKKAAFLADRPKRGNTGERSAAKQVHTAAKHIFNEVWSNQPLLPPSLNERLSLCTSRRRT